MSRGGSVTYKILVDSAQAKAEINHVNANLDGLNRKAGAAGTAGADGMDSLGSKVEQANQKFGAASRSVLKFVGNIGAVAATGAVFYKLGQQIREFVIDRLESGADKAEKFKLSLDMSKSVDSIAKLDEKLKGLQGRLANITAGGPVGAIETYLAGSQKKLEDEIAALQRTRSALLSSDGAKETRKEELESAKAIGTRRADAAKAGMQAELEAARTVIDVESIVARAREKNAADEDAAFQKRLEQEKEEQLERQTIAEKSAISIADEAEKLARLDTQRDREHKAEMDRVERERLAKVRAIEDEKRAYEDLRETIQGVYGGRSTQFFGQPGLDYLQQGLNMLRPGGR